MHISKMINYVKNEIHFTKEFCEDNVFVTLRIEPILRIIENLEQSHKDILEITKENIKKDKIIDFMAECIELQQADNIDTTNLEGICKEKKCKKKCLTVDKECIKQYFKNKAEKE